MISFLRAAMVLVMGTTWLAASPAKAPAKPNIILITIDTVRADRVGCYGAAGVSTPTLDSLARDGILFERAISQVPLTYPSHTAIMTGLYPFQTGAQDFTSSPLAPRFRTIAQELHEHGYATGAVVSSFALDHSWGLARGFDYYDDAFSPEAYQKRDLGLVERKAEESVTHALVWLRRTSKRPFFLWLHLYDPHSPYDPPEPFRTQFASHLYDGEIAYADHELGRLLQWLKQARLYDSSLILMASDHGESLGDHGEKEHGFFVYNSTVHVPLILKPPKDSGYKPGRNSTMVETTDVPATIEKFARLAGGIGGQPLPLSAENGASSAAPAYSETFYPFNSFGWSPLHSLETERFHFIDAPVAELYDVLNDPQEKNNIAASQTATVAVLKDKLRAILDKAPREAANGGASDISPEALAKLRALGYVAYRSPVPQSALLAGLPDPKVKLDEFNAILQAQDAAHAGEFERARALLAAVREKDPQLYIVPFYLGEYASAERNWQVASDEFKECLQISPDFKEAMTGLARTLMFQGKSDEAEQWARKVLAIDPQSYQSWYVIGFINSRQNPKLANDAYEKAIAIQPSFAPLQRDLGTLELQQQEFAKAASHLQKAVDLGSDDPATLNSLGIAYSRTNRAEKALEVYKKAAALNPNVAEIHLNLAAAYRRLRELKSAQAEYEKACQLDARYCH